MDTDTTAEQEVPQPEKIEEEKPRHKHKKEPGVFFTPVAVLIAGAMISGAIVYSLQRSPVPQGENVAAVGAREQGASSAEKVQKVTEKDHVFGDVDAKITLIEFSDFQCPYCASLHPTLTRIVEESSGSIKWVYRHFPLTAIHDEANTAALASECIAQYAGNDAFWTFAEKVFKNQKRLGTPFYEELASAAGVSPKDFASCMISKDTTARITANLDDAIASGGQGTPYVVIVNADGRISSFSGALPYAQVVAQIEKVR